MDAISTATAGLSAAFAQFGQAAQTIASSSGDDLASAAVSMTQAKVAAAANEAVIKSANQMEGSLVNLLV